MEPGQHCLNPFIVGPQSVSSERHESFLRAEYPFGGPKSDIAEDKEI